MTDRRGTCMKRFVMSAGFVALLALAGLNGVSQSRAGENGTSGNGKLRFRVLYTSSILPPEAQKVLTGAHGGFAVDTRPGKGETYFGLKNAGILQIGADLKTVRMIDTPAVKKSTNLHNATI